MKLLLFFISLSAFGAVNNLQVVPATTSTQIAVSATITDPTAACTVEVSESPSFTPLAHDVNGTLFPGSNLCGRSENVRTGNHYIFVIGKQGEAAFGTASTGFGMSRALMANTEYYIRVTNGTSASITVRTTNIPLGIATGQRVAIDSPFRYKLVSTNKIVNPEIADPYTGARIINPANVMGFAYSYTSAHAWTGVSGCGITVAGTPTIKGSCRFTDAAGTNWTATTGTLTDAIQADDGNYAIYANTAQDKLFVRTGTGRRPTSGTYGDPNSEMRMSSQNLAFRALTSDATGEGGWLKTCWTFDGSTCSSPEQRITLTTSEASYIVCHDSPCTTPDNPGDTMVYDRAAVLPGQARIYNVAGSLTTYKFAGPNATAGCNELSVGEPLFVFNSATMSNHTAFYITAKDCGASPPEVSSSSSIDLTNNSTDGSTYWRFVGNTPFNYYLGILLWKESTTSGSTISVDVPLWRSTYIPYWRFNAGAGGFGRNCQNVPTADGYYLCMGGYGGNVIFGVKQSGNGLVFKNYGFATWRGDQLSGSLSASGGWDNYSLAPQQSDANYALWDDETPGVFYSAFGWNGGVANQKAVITKVTLNLVEKTPTDMDSATDLIFNSARAPKAGISSVSILTPCLNTCASASDDYSITKQRLDFSAEWTAQASRFGSCRFEAVQGNDLYEVCKNGGQDTYAWVFVYDLGNKSPIGSGYSGGHSNTIQLYAATALHDTPDCRWCPLHTFQSPAVAGGAPLSVLEGSAYKCYMGVTGTALSSCSVAGNGNCPVTCNGSLDGYTYTGKDWCSNITLSSSDPGGVAEWEDGDPVNAVNCESTVKWLQKLEPGDFLRHGSEFIRLLTRTDNKNWTVIRGWGYPYDTTQYAPTSHGNGDVWYTHWGSLSKDRAVSNPNSPGSLYWYPALSTNAQNTDYSFLGLGQNHGINFSNAIVAVEAAYSATPATMTDPASVKAAYTNQRYSRVPSFFAGKEAFCEGNACERHPSAAQVVAPLSLRSTFADIHPRAYTKTSSTNEQPLVAGKSYIRVYTETVELNPKHFDIESFTGPYGLMRVDTLTDSADDSGKFCIAIVADDCFSGSTAGKVYMVNARMDPSYVNGSRTTCRAVHFASYWGDACTVNASNIGSTLSQYEIPTTANFSNGAGSRALAKIWRYYREAATENTKAMPDGSGFLMRAHWAVMNLPWPGADTRNRATFNGVPVTVTSVPAGTANALVQFGYNSSFQCSGNRDNTCYAESATVSESVPFRFDHETLTGVSCGSGCNIAIPAIPNRLLYWRLVYRDSGGTVLARGATNVQAVQ